MECFEERLIPRPKQLVKLGNMVRIASMGRAWLCFKAESEDPRVLEGINTIKKQVSDLAAVDTFGYQEDAFEVLLKVNREDSRFLGHERRDAYYIQINNNGACLCGYDEGGVFYAAITFAKMLMQQDGEVFVPQVEVFDYPDFERRGHFFECRYGTEFMGKKEWFEAIDYLASMKINQLTIGVYGCWHIQYDARPAEYLFVPINKYPQLQTPKNIKYYSVKDKKWVYKDNLLPKMFQEDCLSEIIAYGKRKNILVKPLFNSLGHNTLIPKAFPEISSINKNGESSGFGFCTENEKTYEVMCQIYDEIIERYLRPNGINEIAIGIDEVDERYRCQCDKCSRTAFSELMVTYIIKICKYLKSKGMKKIYIYHDMLYSDFNMVNEELRDRFVEENIYDEVVLDWWSYEDPNCLFWGKAEGVNNLFHSIMKPFTGYFNWSIPTDHNENIRACTSLAHKLGFEGIEAYGSFDYCYDKNFLTLADVSWNFDEVDKIEEFERRYAYINSPDDVDNALMAFHALRDIMKNDTQERYCNKACFKLEYYYYSYNRPWLPYPQRFPEAMFEEIRDNESEYIQYLEFLKQKSGVAIDFFEKSKATGKINSCWLLTAKHYFALADEYLTLYQLQKFYNNKMTDEFTVLREIDRLIRQREELMYLAEMTKYEPAQYTYLRNMSVFRQLLYDLQSYLKKEISVGNKPILDLYDLKGKVLSDAFEFLR